MTEEKPEKGDMLASSVETSSGVKREGEEEQLKGTAASERSPVKKADSPPVNSAGSTSDEADQQTPAPKKKKLRRGKWTPEEEMFVERIIRDFNAGLLDVPAGTTLRTFLSQKLNCDPMRITKKFTGASCIGKRVFHPRDRNAAVIGELARAKEELAMLEARWRSRLREMESESGKQKARGGSKEQGKHQQSEWQILIGNWMQRAEQALRSATNVHELDLLKEEGRRLRARSVMEQGASKRKQDPDSERGLSEDRDAKDRSAETSVLQSALGEATAPAALCNLKAVER